MSQRRLLSLFCLSLLFLLVVQLTRAGGDLTVDESRTRFMLYSDREEVWLTVENTTGKTRNVTVTLELLDTRDGIRSQTTGTQSVAPGSQKLRFNLPAIEPNLREFDRRNLLWYRLRYRVSETVGSGISVRNGIISLSEIMPDLFELRVATSEILREGGRYRARVQASHPFTHQPAAGVRISGEISFEDNEDLKPKANATTNKEGYALLDFNLPVKLATNSMAEIHVTGSRDGVVAEAEGEVMVDNLVRTLITTDKALYQPGQTMHIRALAFGPTKRARVDQNLSIKVVDPEGVRVFVTTVRSSRFGVVSADWPIPDNVRLGDYRIWVDREGASYETALDVRLSRYDLPNFSVRVEPDRPFYLPGQNARVTVRADYLFGQPVNRGHVRVVEESTREWNFREQKWSVDEGDEYEGETDADGVFVANVDLAGEHDKINGSRYLQFNDLTYAAYFTDPTTNRTEQRRFTLRVTKDAIHVYIIKSTYDSDHNLDLPLPFYVSTYYADGTPARCKLDIVIDREQTAEPNPRSLRSTLRTNRYGLAKTSIRIPREFDPGNAIDLRVVAQDSSGRNGSAKERFWIDDKSRVFVNTEKSLYRAGEPLVATISSNLPDQQLVVELATDASVVRSQRVRLRDGRATVSFAYAPYLTGRITVAAYPDFAEEGRLIGTRAVLYPSSSELTVNAKTSQASYRPGDDASVRLRVRTADGRAAQSALGLVVSDKAVEERMRTDAEFGGRYQPYNNTLINFLGLDEQISGVTFRDLQRLDMTKVVSPELDLLAEILLNNSRGSHYPVFYHGDEYETDLPGVFGPLINVQVRPIIDALNERYLRTLQHPSDEKTLRQFLQEARIDLGQFYDPWGVKYRAVFSIEERVDVFTMMSAGADKRFDTPDDFSVVRLSWEYFKPIGQQIQRAVTVYHLRTKGFIRDRETLRQELARAGVLLDQIRDRWGQPYRIEFGVEQTNYVIKLASGGPNRRFAVEPEEPGDDFSVWLAQIDYFADFRQPIETVLNDKLKSTGKFPQSDAELRDALRDSEQPFETLRDPWDRPYYAVYKTASLYGDRLQIENRAAFGNSPTRQTQLLPVTRIIGTVRLMSAGADGQAGTPDDFAVGAFTRLIGEQPSGKRAPEVVAPTVVLSSTNGAIYGVVVDQQEARVAGATITATRNPDIHHHRTLSDENGEYVLKNLPPGFYEVRFEAPGFVAVVITNVEVEVSSYTTVNATLEPGEITESVTVTSGGNALNMTSPTVSTSYSLGKSRLQVITKSGSTSAEISTPRLREYFPETLVWQPAIETDGRGRADLKFKLADNITTWKMAVIGSTEDGRIGTAETEFKAFQPFFVEHDPPRVLTEGDEISLPVVVRNYLDRPQKVDLEIKPENWFSLLGPARKQTAVEAGDAARQTFDLRAVKSVDDGRQRITAHGADANDAIEKPITVHPDGEELSVTNGDFLASSAAVDLNLPDNVIAGSTRAELKIYPNLMAHVIESVEAIMARPYGCGEQTISSTYPSLMLLRNYKQKGDDFPSRERAQRYLNSGYNRLLNYRAGSGGFAYWGHGNPDIALTAYALRFLTDAAEVMNLDHAVIKHARQWLIQQQKSDGSWPPHEFGITGAPQERRRAVLTAYVARTLVATESRLFSEANDDAGEQERAGLAAALNRALEYVDQRSKEIDEPYLLASYALALIDLGDTARASVVIDKLRSLAHVEGSGAYWALETNTPFYGWGTAGRVETTALVVQAFGRYCNGREGNCGANEEIIKRGLQFLLKQKDRYGVWYSTQGTINVLDTLLTLFAAHQPQRRADGESTARIEINGRVVQTVKLPETRRVVSPITIPITSFLSAGKNRIEIKRPAGGAFSSVQALASYYVPWADKSDKRAESDLRLLTTFDKTESKVGDTITCRVHTERVGFKGYGMMLAEIGLPPGADVDRSPLETALKDWTIMQYDILPDRVVLYLWPQAGGVDFDIRFRPRFGLAAKTAASVIYDYYNPESRVVVAPIKFRVNW